MSIMVPRPANAGSYKAILADPPWTFRTWSERGKGRSAENHYQCMKLDDIKRIPVNDWADDNCALFMWVTDPMLPAGFDVMKAWGFDYKTVAFYWVKTNRDGGFFKGMGYWTRANPEICLLGVKGKIRRKSNNIDRLVIAQRREHSRKPDEVHERIVQLVDGPYLEMFARRRISGWDVWGNEV